MEQLQCPLCKGLSPGDAMACTQCGALFSRPEQRSPLVSPWDLVGVRQAVGGDQADAYTATATEEPPAVRQSPRWIQQSDSGGAGWSVREQHDPDSGLYQMPSSPYAPRVPVNGPTPVAEDEEDDLTTIVKRVLLGIGAVALLAIGLMTVPHLIQTLTATQYKPINLPPSLSGQTQLTNSEWGDAAGSIKVNFELQDGITSSAAAVYGTGSSAQFVLAAEQGSAVSQQSDADALTQFAGTSNYTADGGHRSVQHAGGTGFTCEPIVTGGPATIACTWTNGDLRGFAWVVNNGDPANALNIASAASKSVSQ